MQFKGHGIWELQFIFPDNLESFNYRYVVTNNDGWSLYESSKERTLRLSDFSKCKAVVVESTWTVSSQLWAFLSLMLIWIFYSLHLILRQLLMSTLLCLLEWSMEGRNQLQLWPAPWAHTHARVCITHQFFLPVSQLLSCLKCDPSSHSLCWLVQVKVSQFGSTCTLVMCQRTLSWEYLVTLNSSASM